MGGREGGGKMAARRLLTWVDWGRFFVFFSLFFFLNLHRRPNQPKKPLHKNSEIVCPILLVRNDSV